MDDAGGEEGAPVRVLYDFSRIGRSRHTDWQDVRQKGENTAELREISEILGKKSRSMCIQYKGICSDLDAWSSDGNHASHANELRFWGIGPRMQDFLTHRLLLSAKSVWGVEPDGKVVKKTQYMRRSTLQKIKHTLTSLISDVKRLSLEEGKLLSKLLNDHVTTLSDTYALRTRPRHYVIFGTPEIRLLIEEAMRGISDTNIQKVCMILFCYYTAARPGSIFFDPSSPTYLLIKDINITRRFAEGLTHGFDIRIEFHTMKGYQSWRSIEVCFYVRAMNEEKNIIFDLGLYLVAHLYRRGVFDLSPEDLWDGKEINLPSIALSEGNSALFLQPHQGSRPGFKQKPMTTSGFAKQFASLASDAGLNDVNEDGTTVKATPYAIRKGTATALNTAIGPTLTKIFMGHQQDSYSLETVYDQASRRVDLAGVLGGEGALNDQDINLNLKNAPYLRSELPRPASMKLSELINNDPKLSAIEADIKVIRASLACGSEDWMKLPSLIGSPLNSGQALLALQLARDERANRLEYWRSAHQREYAASYLEIDRAVLTAKIREAYARNLTPSTLPDDLIALAGPMSRTVIGERRDTIKEMLSGSSSSTTTAPSCASAPDQITIEVEEDLYWNEAAVAQPDHDEEDGLVNTIHDDLDDEEGDESEDEGDMRKIEEAARKVGGKEKSKGKGKAKDTEEDPALAKRLGSLERIQGRDEKQVADARRKDKEVSEAGGQPSGTGAVASLMSKRRAFFLTLCAPEKAAPKDRLCQLCRDDITIEDDHDLLYRHDNQRYGTHVISRFHSARFQLQRYLHLHTTLKFPKAFESIGLKKSSSGTTSSTKPNFDCPYCDWHGTSGGRKNQNSIVIHLGKEHMNEIPAAYRDGVNDVRAGRTGHADITGRNTTDKIDPEDVEDDWLEASNEVWDTRLKNTVNWLFPNEPAATTMAYEHQLDAPKFSHRHKLTAPKFSHELGLAAPNFTHKHGLAAPMFPPKQLSLPVTPLAIGKPSFRSQKFERLSESVTMELGSDEDVD